MSPAASVMGPYENCVPPLSDKEYAELKSDIEAHGVTVPIIRDGEGNVIDGHHRARACHELGLPGPPYQTEWVEGAEARSLARRLNVHRRQLSQAQRRELVKSELADAPEKSNRQIAETTGTSPTTVGEVRTELENSGELSRLDSRTGKDGKSRPARKRTTQNLDDYLAEQRTDEPATSPKPPRKPITDDFMAASLDLKRSVTRITEIAGDARFSRNLAVISERHLSDMVRARDAIQLIITQLGETQQ